MKTKLHSLVAALAMLSGLNGQVSTACAQGTAFTYEGQLQDNGGPANGAFNLVFTLFTNKTGGTPIVSPVTNNAALITNGLFTVLIDFGPGAFNGQTNWLQVSVETNGASEFTILSPRQQLTPTPYAIFAETAGNLSGTVSPAQLNGAVGNGQLANSSITVTAGTGLTGGGTVALGGSITLNATGSGSGILSVTGNPDITASTVGGAVTLGDTATSANTGSTMVKRDSSGSFSAGTITLAGNLTFPSTATSPDIIYSGRSLLLYGDCKGNFFTGLDAGNLTTTGENNTAVGWGSLSNNTSGAYNTAVGLGALEHNNIGSRNTALGRDALFTSDTGTNNTAAGFEALANNTSGSDNTAVGYAALYENDAASQNGASQSDP